MAITAAVSLSSAAGDLVSSALTISTSTALTKAGLSTALANTSGLAKKTTTTTSEYVLLYADDYTDSKAHKLYIKNTSATPADFFTISNGDEALGLMYAGDWALIPWGAINGTKATFTATVTGDWIATDTAIFDGVTITATGATEGIHVGNVLRAASYPNWIASGTADAAAVTFTAKRSDYLGLIETGAASDDWVVDTDGSGTIVIARGVTAVASANDIKITPGQNANTVEWMLFNE